MLVKIAILFLAFMVALALFGRGLRPGGKRGRLQARTCPSCGAPRVGRGPCPCGRA